ncbi:MAG: prepilin-type N-terminal cleavage/methylation domain-containing protein [Candidatus Zixiibacteriota bacterium]
MICRNRAGDCQGFTLIEVILVIVITGILVIIAFRSAMVVSNTAKVEQTKQELDGLAFAIVGNPELENNGVRADFGYVGDVGALPPDLDALVQNPGGYSTWNGPYIRRRFSQVTDDYKRDAWGNLYQYSAGVTITSTGGSGIVRKLANSTADLLQNRVNGVVYDLDGTPPGSIYRDSVTVRLTIPDGVGGMMTKNAAVDAGGYFSFDSIPIGNHDLDVIYIPDSDTLNRFVSVIPGSSPYGEYFLDSNLWYDTTSGSTSGGLEYVAGSAQTQTGNCDRIEFDVINTSGSSITVTSMTLTWSSPTAYYEKVKFDGGAHVFDQNNPRAGSGEVVTFSTSKVVNSGNTATVRVEKFTDVQSGGGSSVDMSNTTMTVTFSDGSSFSINTGACN